MAGIAQSAATIDDLYRVSEKAELIAGRIVPIAPTGDAPNSAALEIAVSLREYARRTGIGAAYIDGIGFALKKPLASGRQSLSPDVSFHIGPRPKNRMRFVEGAATFAAEVRSENDYGPAAEAAMAAKRVDYIAAGSRVVWDVDPVARTVSVYRGDPDTPESVYTSGQVAEAEPALPG
jgi:Uma2 family endonuclease